MSQRTSVLWRAAYDGDGARRKRADGKGTIHYLRGYERNVGNGQETAETITKYYRALGRLVTIRKNDILYWIGTDHLGGTIRVADNEFNPVGQMRYMPYGVSRDDPSLLPHDYLFTDQQLDASIGLYWYGSRAYDHYLNHFIQPDTIVPQPGNPQSLNRYSYALNNPLRYTDPSGHVAILPGMGGAQEYSNGSIQVTVVGNVKDPWSLVAAGVLDPVVANLVAQGNTVTVGRALVVSPDDINDPAYVDLLSHELAHTRQAEKYATDLQWRIAYALSYASAAQLFGAENAYKMNYFEILADRDAFKGLNDFWHSEHSPIAPSPSANNATPVPQGMYPTASGLNSVGGVGLATPIPAGAWGALGTYSIQVALSDSGEFIGSIPAGLAPGGVGVVNITVGNPSGQPEDGRGWDAQDQAAREAAWIRGGSPDYNALREAGVPGYC